MMNIGLAISGNLTGFSRFYANDAAKNLLNTTKFNFDVHNMVSFLNNGEKLYAIFFSKDIIAVSLITNILDSFRRPGNLVVTTLLPRGYKIVDKFSATKEDALYHLLNEVNEKFYERNFLNGMINQNPAVLMQDYYTEILSKFGLEPDSSQRKINSLIDITAPNKRSGYISTPERNIPSYLSSIFRKSYEGYHYVFLASNAPQNIDEPAEEILTYKVRIENGNRHIPGEVRLTDKIPNVNPEQGEKDIPNKDFTYGQIIAGEAGNYIVGSIEKDETIILSYRFPKEDKTVYFRFYDGADEVPIALIRPFIVDSNGVSFNIPSDNYTFYGKEIYGHKTIKSGNPEYSIVGPSVNLDLQRVQNGATININVERGWLWQFTPMLNNRPATIKPVNITLINRYNGDRKTFTNVTSAISEKLSGNQSEWEMIIESDYYKEVKVPVNTPYRLDPKPVSQHTTSPSVNNVKGGSSVNPLNRTTLTGQNDQGLKISKGEQHTAKDSEQIRREKNKRYMTYGAAVIVACLLVLGGIWGYKALFEVKKTGRAQKNDIEQIVEDSKNETKYLTLSFVGIDGDQLSQSTIDKLTLTFDPEQNVELNPDGTGYCVKYNPDNDPTDNVKINVSYVGCNLLSEDYKSTFEIKDLPDVVTVELSVKESDINLYDKIMAGVSSAKEYEAYQKKVKYITDHLNGPYGTVLSALLLPQNRFYTETPQDNQSNDDVRKDDANITQDNKTPLFDLGWTSSTVKEMKQQPEYQDYQAQLTSIEKCLNGLKAGKIIIPDKLPNNFKEVMNQLKGLEDRINKISDESKKAAAMKTFIEVIKDKSESVYKERDNLVAGCKLDNRIMAAEN